MIDLKIFSKINKRQWPVVLSTIKNVGYLHPFYQTE